MWWGLGFVGVVLWLTLLVVLGTATLGNGHWVLFILGIPLPIFWAIGALIEPTPRAREAF
jgi:hypothetical protein